MTYESFRRNSQKEYLGFCEQKGYIYSVMLDAGRYAVVALRNAEITILITYSVHASPIFR
ncbi:hypothetical protein [Bacillus sp. FJAT-26390]|uniref:hypothetical protein n=1 Tax=Bacillus sp. FJAT-26390 TaxID=1743142 RepID=UPI000807AEA6|nr:hypothetical protein [Bacillus sp. FJAT-26390]OBZ17102.1 hypothetical protein A7975_04230 [Bacillus sp. FJAT-26390]